MASFKVGDKVRFKPGVYTSHEVFDWKSLYWHPDESLPEYFAFKDVYTILYSENEVEIDAIPGGWLVSSQALEHVNLLTKAERFAKSKHRVETRHLRNKGCQQKTEPVQGARPRDEILQTTISFSSLTVPAGTVLGAATSNQYLDAVGIAPRRPIFSLDYLLS